MQQFKGQVKTSPAFSGRLRVVIINIREQPAKPFSDLNKPGLEPSCFITGGQVIIGFQAAAREGPVKPLKTVF